MKKILRSKLKNLNETIKDEKKPKFLKDSSFTFFIVTLIMFFIPIIFILSDENSLNSFIFFGVVIFALVLLVVLIFLMPYSSPSSKFSKDVKDVDKLIDFALTSLKSSSTEERFEAIIILAKLIPNLDFVKMQNIANSLMDFIKVNYAHIANISFEEERDEHKKKIYYDKLQARSEYKQQISKTLKLLLEIFKLIKQKPNFSDFYLGELDLNFFDFSHAILNKTNFEGSDLFLAKFKDTDLFLANFRNCNLCMVNFEMAHLEGVNLENANASDAKLYGANMSKVSSTLNTNFTGAKYNSINIGSIPPTNFPRDLQKKEDRDFLGMKEDNILIN